MERPCYGSYEDLGECATCALLYPCIDLTITIDKQMDREYWARMEGDSWLQDKVDEEIERRIYEYRNR